MSAVINARGELMSAVINVRGELVSEVINVRGELLTAVINVSGDYWQRWLSNTGPDIRLGLGFCGGRCKWLIINN